MAYTAEGAKRELERRHQLKFNESGYTPEGARAELERRRALREPPNQWMEAAKGFGAAGVGAGETVYNTLASIANAPATLIDKITGLNTKTPHVNLSKYVPEGQYSDIGYGAGQFAGNFVPGLGVYGALGKIGKTEGFMGALNSILRGGATGALVGEDAEGNRLNSAIFGAGLGPVAHFGGKLAKNIGKIPKGIQNIERGTPEKVTERIINVDLPRKNAEANSVFKQLNTDIKNSGVQHIFEGKPTSHLVQYGRNSPKVEADLSKKLNWNKIEGYLKPEARKSFENFLRNDNYENARKLSTSFRLSLEKLSKNSDNLPETNEAIRHLARSKEVLDRNIVRTLKKHGGKNLAKKHLETNKWYGEEVAPLKHNKYIKDYKAKKLTEEGLFERLKHDEPFKRQIGKREYPELWARDEFKKLAKYSGIGAGTIGTMGGGTYLYDKIFGGSK